MSREQRLKQLAVEIKRNMRLLGMNSVSQDEALMMAEMGKDPVKLRRVLETLTHDAGTLEIYQRFCGGVQ